MLEQPNEFDGGCLCVEADSLDSPLWRHIKKSQIVDDAVTIDFLDLRKNLVPPEPFISFTYGGSGSFCEQFVNVITDLFPRKREFGESARFAVVDVAVAYEEINRVRKIIEFKDEGSPHFGLYYVSDLDADILEAKTALLAIIEVSKSISSYDEVHCFYVGRCNELKRSVKTGRENSHGV